MRVVVAMSGGVDSAVAAALLVEQGHEVVGLSMQLYDQREGEAGFGTCCTADDLHDARRVAAVLGIPHYLVNFEREFGEQVVSNFVSEYAAGRTPLPCARCNSELKFATLLQRAGGLGADAVATGHYARVERSAHRFILKRGADAAKDQSYFLFSLDQTQLASALFPVGDLTKDAVRRYASDRQLPVAAKPDSQEICFVPDNDYAGFIERQAPEIASDGVIVDVEGHVVGRHRGIHHFTIGQRKGLGLSSRVPLYVLKLNAREQTLTVGPRQALDRTTLTASAVNWIACDPPSRAMPVTVQIRHRHTAADATVRSLDDGRAEVVFEAPQLAVTPGQAAVFYEGETVLGGGWIE